MAIEVVVATLNVSFEDDSDGTRGVLKLERDDREDGLNGGDTRFSPGDDAYYFLFKDTNVTVIHHDTTAGGKSGSGSGTKAIDENITFSNSDTSSLGYPPDGSVTMSWLGRSFEIRGTQVLSNTSLPEINGSELKMPGGKKVVGLLNCKYNATGDLFKLSGVPVDFPEALIFAVGTIGT
jgi:hypothetical protein